MSYDVYVECKLEGYDEWISVTDGNNITYNLADMFDAACGARPSLWHLQPCGYVLQLVTKGINELEKYPEKYKRYEASNGWGTIKGALSFLRRVRIDCEKYQKGRIFVG